MTLSLYSVSTDFVSRNANFVSLLTANHSGLGAIRHQSSDFNSVVRSHSVSAGGHCDIATEEVLSISDKYIDLNSSGDIEFKWSFNGFYNFLWNLIFSGCLIRQNFAIQNFRQCWKYGIQWRR